MEAHRSHTSKEKEATNENSCFQCGIPPSSPYHKHGYVDQLLAEQTLETKDFLSKKGRIILYI